MVKVSIILPNYNHSEYLPQRIESILNQTYQDFEVIILDDSSTDNSLEVLNHYRDHPKVTHFIVNEKNSGSVFRQWNKGVSLAQGEFIWIAESDDIASPFFLERLTNQLLEDQNLGIAFCQSNKINSLSEVYGDWLDHTKEKENNLFMNSFKMNGNAFITRFLIEKNSIPNASAVVFRKDIYLRTGGPLENLKTVGDWNIWVKILSFSNVYFHHEKLNSFRMHDSSCVAISIKNDSKCNIILMFIEMYKDLSKFSDKKNPTMSKYFKYKKDINTLRFIYTCIASKNYEKLFNNPYGSRIYFIFFTPYLYIALLKFYFPSVFRIIGTTK